MQLGIDALLVKALTKNMCPSPEQAPKQGSKEKDDPDLLFCLSIVDTLKRLDGRKKSLAKMKIQEVLFALEFEEWLSSLTSMTHCVFLLIDRIAHKNVLQLFWYKL